MSRRRGQLYVGTSGWTYDWEEFYPADLPDRRRLEYYAGQFPTVEVNYSFYHLPLRKTYDKWAGQTPDGFLFALKLSRFITHIKRLQGVKTAFRTFLQRATPLGVKLGPVLVQLPPSFRLDLPRLEKFLAQAQDVGRERHVQPLRIACEFRHPSWFADEARQVLDVLTRHGAAFVCAHSSRYPYPATETLTGDFMYLRFHGPERMFASAYGRKGLKRWVPLVERLLAGGIDVFAYFNNDDGGHAVRDARALLSLVGE
jgi:uncharacterized protein YecE (DUF72 family)